MNLSRRKLLFGLAICPLCAPARGEGAHWSYEGEARPERWSELDASFKACATGDQQSPVDLSKTINADIGSATPSWSKQAYEIVNNGHTIQANAAPGDGLLLDGQRYELKQFHFHTPSEHAIAGHRTAMEVHFVHAHASGRLAVVGALMVPGKANAAFAGVMAKAPKTAGKTKLAAAIDPMTFWPQGGIYRYEGSLTTPPCSEIVDWIVFERPVEVAAADIAAFKAIFPMNARPLQPLNRRFLLAGHH